MIGVIFIFYLVPLIHFYRARETIALKARSPKLMFICIVLLCGDSISNTVIFLSPISNSGEICDLSIATTVCFYFGVLAVYYLRMHRVEQVYLCYNQYLKQQIESLEHNSPTVQRNSTHLVEVVTNAESSKAMTMIKEVHSELTDHSKSQDSLNRTQQDKTGSHIESEKGSDVDKNQKKKVLESMVV